MTRTRLTRERGPTDICGRAATRSKRGHQKFSAISLGILCWDCRKAIERMKVFIENEAGSLVKHEHNEKTFELLRTSQVSRPFPRPYGFVLNTTAEDGDNVDCFVLTKEHLYTGDIVVCEPVGLMEQIEDGEVDHKVLAVLPGE